MKTEQRKRKQWKKTPELLPDLRKAANLEKAQGSPGMLADEEAQQTMERIKGALVLFYLAANLDCQVVPLKDLMEGVEIKILKTCLQLTRGNQKNAAQVLGIRPTVLFEKMRKYGIARQQAPIPNSLAPKLMEMAVKEIDELETASALLNGSLAPR